jgi:hypothetical protein
MTCETSLPQAAARECLFIPAKIDPHFLTLLCLPGANKNDGLEIFPCNAHRFWPDHDNYRPKLSARFTGNSLVFLASYLPTPQ